MERPAAAAGVRVDDSDEDVTLPLPWERRCGLEGQAVYYNTLTHESQRHFPGTDPPAVAAVPKVGTESTRISISHCVGTHKR